MKKTLYILIFLLFPTATYSQKNDYNVWVIGYNLTLDFNTPDGSPILTKDYTLDEGEFNEHFYPIHSKGGTICDSNGNIQYFGIGNLVFNKYNYLQEPRENYLGGFTQNIENEGNWNITDINYSTLQSNIFIRYGSNFMRIINHYYDGYVYYLKNNHLKLKSKLAYDISDKNSNRIEESKIAYENIESPAMCAIKKIGTEDYWVILYDNKRNYYYSFEVTKNGISSEYKDRFYSEKTDSLIGTRLKASTNGQLIANVINHKHDRSIDYTHIEVLNFDPYRGKFLNKRIEISSEIVSDLEFSENGRYLYYDKKDDLIQFDLINKSEYEVGSLNYLNVINQIQIGPDKMIYVTTSRRDQSININQKLKYKSNFTIFKVENSNRGEIARVKTHIPGGVLDSVTTVGFPNIPASYYLDLYTDFDKEVCPGDSVQLRADLLVEHDSATYAWSGPNAYKSTEQNPVIENANQSHAGLYTVTVETDTDTYSAETFVRVKPSPTPAIRAYPKAFMCEKGDITLSLIDEHESYLWSTGDTTKFIVIDESGTYGVTVENEQGCTGYTEIQVGFGDEYQLAITGDTIKCEGESVTLTSEEKHPSYRWSNGADTRSITVVEPANYTLTITTEDGCEIKRTIKVKDHPNVIAELKPAPTTICEGDSVLLESKYDAPYFDYLWNTDATAKSIYASETGTYKLTITDIRTGCVDSTEIAISVEDNLQPTIIGTNICEGETATLEALPNDPSYNYKWSNGETTPTIEVSQPATYTVTVSKDGCSGTAEFIVNESPNPEFEILGEDIVCGNTAILSSDKDFAEYLWSTDEITKEIEVTEAGTYTLTVTDENGCSATQEFTVIEQSLSFEISKDRIDFGKVYISETRKDSVVIINTSGIELTITDGTQKYTIPDGFPVQYTKTLKPIELGPYTDSFEYRVIEPCDTVITIPVTAEVYAKVEISTKDIDTEIGKEETIPVYLECEADLSEQTYTITTDIDKTVLFTEDEFAITQTAPINQAKTLIHEINGMIMLANELEYDITFPSYEFNNPYIEVSTEQGTIKIDSVCAFPLRNVTLLESTEMRVSPNPARDRLVVVVTTGYFDKLNDQSNKSVAELVEMEDENKASRFDRLSDQRGQRMQLELISSEGRVAYTENWTQTSSEKQISINTDKITSGLYQVRLQTPIGVLTENVIVVR